MPRIITLLILLAFVGTLLPQSDVHSQDSSEKNWSDLSEQEKEAVKGEILSKYSNKDIPFRKRSEYSEYTDWSDNSLEGDVPMYKLSLLPNH